MRIRKSAIFCVSLATAIARLAAAQTPSAVRSLEDFRHFALMHEGDTDRGKALFSDPQKSACSKCHTVDGSAAKAGPDLFAAGDKFGRRELC